MPIKGAAVAAAVTNAYDGRVATTWELGPLEAIDPKLIAPDKEDPLPEIMLTLALIFNDLKTCSLLTKDVGKQHPGSGLSAEIGQRDGIALHLLRIAAGILYELLVLLENKKVELAHESFKALESRLPPQARRHWDALLVHSRPPKSPQALLLVRIRSHSTFHYYQTVPLAKAYDVWFSNPLKVTHQEKAYFSLGNDSDATRFYYADAAVEQSFISQGVNLNLKHAGREIADLARATNMALSSLLRAYLTSRTTSGPGLQVDH